MFNFINKDNKIIVNIYTYEDENKKVYIWSDNLTELKPEVFSLEKVNKNTIIFNPPSFKDSIDISSKSSKFVNGEIVYDPQLITWNRFVKLLHDWDFSDLDGNKIPVNEENVGILNTLLAQIVAIDLEKQIAARQ